MSIHGSIATPGHAGENIRVTFETRVISERRRRNGRAMIRATEKGEQVSLTLFQAGDSTAHAAPTMAIYTPRLFLRVKGRQVGGLALRRAREKSDLRLSMARGAKRVLVLQRQRGGRPAGAEHRDADEDWNQAEEETTEHLAATPKPQQLDAESVSMAVTVLAPLIVVSLTLTHPPTLKLPASVSKLVFESV